MGRSEGSQSRRAGCGAPLGAPLGARQQDGRLLSQGVNVRRRRREHRRAAAPGQTRRASRQAVWASAGKGDELDRGDEPAQGGH
ncbi:MAG: hypothetical protein NFW16_09025 [Candidatus Accumulibacter sp.]|uniref:hypothetical protein n=1 Tax=Accumulibacter sp. TaxID=2053492 RepID=UPI002583B804|nr:hypothetical protein [Accumulibacter sp.]MCM8621865.1 hypothetical protein [Accumulibacter sp.]